MLHARRLWLRHSPSSCLAQTCLTVTRSLSTNISSGALSPLSIFLFIYSISFFLLFDKFILEKLILWVFSPYEFITQICLANGHTLCVSSHKCHPNLKCLLDAIMMSLIEHWRWWRWFIDYSISFTQCSSSFSKLVCTSASTFLCMSLSLSLHICVCSHSLLIQ